jgi:DMSO/TMAO reductase YedYZ molybdopterin-dependent catalytic subunit
MVVIEDHAPPVRRIGWGRAAWCGVLAAALALGVAELVSGLLEGTDNPVVSVGESVIDLVPPFVKDFAIEVFGTTDKQALIIGTLLLLAGFSAVVGVLAARRRWMGYAGIGLFAVVGVLAAITRYDATWVAALPTLAGAAAAAVALPKLLDPGSTVATVTPDPDAVSSPVPSVPAPDRRRFLLAAIGTGSAAVIAGGLGRVLRARFQVDAARAALVLPRPASPAVAAGPEVAVAVEGAEPYLTPNGRFYRIDTALVVPQLSPDVWSLRVGGMVDRELTLTYDELLARPMVERIVTLACVSNEVGGRLVGNARWLGVPLADVLRDAGVQQGADQLVSRSYDGWTCGTPTAAVLDGRDALLAIGMNGEPLPVSHGFPVRMVVPGLYGYVSATKWVTELELTTFADFDAYWVRRGWAAQAPIKTMARIDVPRSGASLGAGTVAVAGVAWAPHRGIRAVEVQVDDGEWQQAELAAEPTVDAWRQWVFAWDAFPGRHVLRARATDGDGAVQTGEEAAPVPDGATGWHSIVIEIP